MLQKEFPASFLTISAAATKKMIAFKTGSMTAELAYKKLETNTNDSQNLIWECAMKLRQDIMDVECFPLEEPLSVGQIMKGEASVPNSVTEFFTTLYTGSRYRHSDNISKRKQRLIDSTSADVLYASSGGKLLPGKHLSLALALKSMTGSKTVTNLLNRLRHCVSNEKVRRIDIGLESTISQNNNILPENIKKDANSCIGTGWDDFDINLETLSGANSIQHLFQTYNKTN